MSRCLNILKAYESRLGLGCIVVEVEGGGRDGDSNGLLLLMRYSVRLRRFPSLLVEVAVVWRSRKWVQGVGPFKCIVFARILAVTYPLKRKS